MSISPLETVNKPKTPGSSESEEQQRFVEEVAPHLERLLIEFGTDKIEGTNNTVEFDCEENRLTLVSNSSQETVLDAEWDAEQDKWLDKGSSLTSNDCDRIIGATENILWKKELNEEQQRFVEEVAPHLVDILNEFDTDKYKGRNNTVEFEREENRLTLVSNLSRETVLDAEWDAEQDRWLDKGSSLTSDDRDQIVNVAKILLQEKEKTGFER